MNPFAQKFLLTIAAAHYAVVGAGSGERVLYFGVDHAPQGCEAKDDAGGHSHPHEHHSEAEPADRAHHHGCTDASDPADWGGHAGWLHFLPIALPVNADHGDHHDHGCGHIHLNGTDALLRASRAAPTPIPIAIPALWTILIPAWKEPRAAQAPRCGEATARAGPLAPPLATDRWLI